MFACVVGALAGGWLAFLNTLVVLDTRSVTVAVEAAAFGLAGGAIALVAGRAAWVRRRRVPAAPVAPDALPEDDPLARYRRRKFGAR